MLAALVADVAACTLGATGGGCIRTHDGRYFSVSYSWLLPSLLSSSLSLSSSSLSSTSSLSSSCSASSLLFFSSTLSLRELKVPNFGDAPFLKLYGMVVEEHVAVGDASTLVHALRRRGARGRDQVAMLFLGGTTKETIIYLAKHYCTD